MDLATVIASAAKECGAPAELTDLVIDALIEIEVTTWPDLRGYGDNCLIAREPSVAALVAFRTALLGTAAGLVDSATLRTYISCVVLSVQKTHRAETAPTPKVTTPGILEPEVKERSSTIGAYINLQRLQGREYDLTQKATFAGEALRDVTSWGYISSVPSVLTVRTLGCGAGAKRRISLGGMDDGSGTQSTIELGESKPTDANDKPRMVTNTRCIIGGILAVLGGTQIDTATYGGGEEGWVPVPGQVEQARVMLPVKDADDWCWDLTNSPLNGSSYARMVDFQITYFIEAHAAGGVHPVLILRGMRQDPARYRTDPNPQAVKDAPAAETLKGGGGSKAGSGADCSSWTVNGNCNDDDCPHAHNDRRRNAFNGGGGGQGGGKKSNRGSRGGGGSQNDSGWGNRGPSYPPPWSQPPWSSGGKGGKGKGGNGGKKGGKGGWNNNNINNNSNNNAGWGWW